jgi:putative DNA primase/helicase
MSDTEHMFPVYAPYDVPFDESAGDDPRQNHQEPKSVEAAAPSLDDSSQVLTTDSTPATAEVEPPPKARKPRKKKRTLPDPADMTDAWMAGQYVELYGDRLRYCPSWRKWLEYDGKRWVRDQLSVAERLARELVATLREHILKLPKRADRDAYVAKVRCFESVGRLSAIVKLAQSDERIAVEPSVFDKSRFLLNCLNGTLDLKTGSLSPHRPEDRITKLAPVVYDPDAACPKWDAFLTTIMGNSDDTIRYLGRVAGYALTGDVGERCLILCHGHGRNGKSVFLKTLLHVFGDYGMSAPSHLLTSAGRQQHPTAFADLDGMRLVTISELTDGKFDEALVKQLTGGDPIRAHKMHCDFYQFNPTHKFVIASNHKPEVKEVGLAIWSRFKLVGFGVTIHLSDVDKGLQAKLQEESAGILAWAVRGCLEWQRLGGLAEPVGVLQATNEYQAEMDPLAAWIADRCVEDVRQETNSTELWDDYIKWSERQGVPTDERVRNQCDFGARLGKKGFTVHRVGAGRMRSRIGLKPDDGL